MILHRWAASLAGASGWRQREFGVDVTTLAPYKGVPVGLVTFRLFIVDFQVHYAFIGKRLLAATQRWIISEAIDASKAVEGPGKAAAPAAPATVPAPALATAPGERDLANLLLEIRPERFQRAAATLGIGWQSRMRNACHANLPAQFIISELLGSGYGARWAAESLRQFGAIPFCPAGGTYEADPATGRVACTVHGQPWSPRQPLEARGDEPFLRFLGSLKAVRSSFRFTPEGIRTKVTIER